MELWSFMDSEFFQLFVTQQGTWQSPPPSTTWLLSEYTATWLLPQPTLELGPEVLASLPGILPEQWGWDGGWPKAVSTSSRVDGPAFTKVPPATCPAVWLHLCTFPNQRYGSWLIELPQGNAWNAINAESSTRRSPTGLPLTILPSLTSEAGDNLSLLGAAP